MQEIGATGRPQTQETHKIWKPLANPNIGAFGIKFGIGYLNYS